MACRTKGLRALLGLRKAWAAAAQRGLAHEAAEEREVAAAAASATKWRQQRNLLPLTVVTQQLTAGDAAAPTAAAARAVSITVLNGLSQQTHIMINCGSPPGNRLVPALGPWLFGFVCGSAAAASAIGYSCLGHSPPAAGAAAAGAAAGGPPLAAPDRGFAVAGLLGSSSSSWRNDAPGVAEVLTQVSLPGSWGGGSSSGSSGSSSSSSVWSYLQQLAALAAPAAQAAALPAGAKQQGRRLLPTPWEEDVPATTSSGSNRPAAAAAAAGPDSSGDAVLRRNSITQAAAAAAPAVVHIVAAGAADPLHRAAGSGFIYHPGGPNEPAFILTAAHVVQAAPPPPPPPHTSTTHQGISRLLPLPHALRSSSDDGSSGSSSGGSVGPMVHLPDGRVFEGRVVAADRVSDLAVVEIRPPGPLPAATLGDSNKLRVGEWVLALGSPLLLRQSVTAGIVSCVERRGPELGMARLAGGFIQTDAAINRGSSGGPLLDLDGRVVGLAALRADGAHGICFAVPINAVKALLSEISRHGRVRRPFAGLTLAEVGAARLAQLRGSCPEFPPGVSGGVVVTRVAPRSPAELAGLQQDDVIVAAAQLGESVRPGQALTAEVLAERLKQSIGGSLELLVVREQQAGAAAAAAAAAAGDSSSRRYGFVTVTLRPVEAPAG